MLSSNYIEFEPVILKDTSGYYYRDGSDDLMIIKEINAGAWSDLCIETGDKVLDLGAHIGLTSSNFLKKTKYVTSVEADPRTVKLIKLNAPQATLITGVVGVEDGETTFYLARNASWRQSTTPVEGGIPLTVPAISFVKLVQGKDVIKCDIEGGERVLPWEKVPSTVKTIGIEIHNYRENMQFAKEFFSLMQSKGFKSEISKSTPPSRECDKVFILKRKNFLSPQHHHRNSYAISR